MADLPSTEIASSPATPRAEKIRRLLYKGYTPIEIGKRIKDPRKRKVVMTQAYRIIATDPGLQQAAAEEAKGKLISGVAPTSAAMARRGSRGNVQAAKLVFEVSGFHNPKIQHEHSGEVKISLNMPRPSADPGKTATDEVVDAEVVEEE